MIKQVIAALLATSSWVPVQAQDSEAQEDGRQRLSRPERVEAIKEQAARGDRQQPPAYQAPTYQAPAQQQRPERQPRPDQQAQFGGQGRGDRRGREMQAGLPARQRFEQQGNVQLDGDAQRRDRGDRGFDRRDPSGYDRQRDRAQGVYTQRDPSGADAVRRYEDQQRSSRRDDDRGNRRDDQRDDHRYGGNRYEQRGGVFGGFQQRGGYTAGYLNRGNWNRGWRNDNRYDWGSYRQSNRNAFHLPRYYAPYGWNSGYRRFSIGVSLSSVLWGQDYWIEEPDYYRLPPAYGPYRWVRYYNDALLVDTETGEVIDTVYDIFY